MSLEQSRATVNVVQPDPGLRQEIADLARSMELDVLTFTNPETFLQDFDSTKAGCVVLELHMPSLSGLDVQARLIAENKPISLIFLAGANDLSAAMTAMKAGAVDLLEKPLRSHELADAIRRAVVKDQANREQIARHADLRAKLLRLTVGERRVLERIVAGERKTEIAKGLGLSIRTIEVRRSKIMRKIQAQTLPDLIRFAVLIELSGIGDT